MKRKIILFLFLMSLGTMAFAASCQLTGGGLLDSLLNKYFTSANAWVTYLQPIAIRMYWFWFTAELLYQITFKKVLANDMQKLWYFLTIRVFTGYMFATIFVDPAFYTGIIQYFVNLGGAAGGYTVTPTSGNPFGALSPSSVMNVGGCVWNSAYTAISGGDLGGGLTRKGIELPDLKSVFTIGMPVLTLAFISYGLAAIMALILFLTSLEAYIVLNAGVILLGFAGSSWTQGFWNKYLSYVGGLAIRFFVMCLILSLVKQTIETDMAELAAATNKLAPGTLLSGMADLVGAGLKSTIDMLICTFLVIKVPQTAGAMLTGSVNAGMGDVIQGAAMMLAGAGLAKGLAKMGINMAGGSGGGGENSAKEKFKDSLRGPGGGGLPSGGSKGGSTGATKTDSQTAKSAMSAKDKANAMADLCGVSTEDKSGGGSNSSSGDSGTSGGSGSSGSGGSSEDGSGSSSSSSESGSGGASSGSSTSSGNDGTTNSQSSGSSNSSGNGSSSSGSGSSSSNSTPSGGMSGNGGGSSGNKPASKSATKDEDTQKSKNDAIIKDMIKNKDSLIRSAKQMGGGGGHAGAAEINANPHKHD